MTDDASLHASMASLRKAFAAQLPERHTAISAQWQPIRDGLAELDHLQELIRLVHSLSGTGRTYGFQTIGELAKTLELGLQADFEQGRLPDPSRFAALQEQFDTLGRLCQEAAHAPTDDNAQADVAPQALLDITGSTLLYLLEDDRSQGQFLATQLGHFGYHIKHFETIAPLLDALKTGTPAAFILDIVTKEGPMAGIKLGAQLQTMHAEAIPMTFLSSRDDIQARLEAVRSGGDAYLTKPVDINQLVDVLDRLTSKTPPPPYRVLIVDDEASVAGFHEALLRQAGMETHIVNQPLQALQAIAEFAPELILMDMHMPECTGTELAQIIRQQGNYNGIPIIFLSAEKNAEKQFDALRSGADDFLTKPISPADLIRSVSIRAERSRMVNALMVRDSMTGLYNHARSKEILAAEFARAKRSNTPASVAMVDIDKFKSINDTYGHPVGDRVIKSLARLIKERLRVSDVGGRYGGEEFIMILPDCNLQDAARIVDDLRARFSQIRHAGGEHGDFSASFSAGVAAFPVCNSPEQLILSADAALYQAKHRGRNRVVMATRAIDTADPA